MLNEEWAFPRSEEKDLFLEGFRKAGLPLCTTQEQLEKFPNPKRIPDCEFSRGGTAGTAKRE
jgi:hypothetical protein